MDKQVTVLRKGWKFFLGEQEDAWYAGFDDNHFREVTIPHDWAVEGDFDISCSSGTGYLPGGTGWYRLHFQVPEKYKEKAVTLLFDGVYKNARVWLNSVHLGKHPYGYTEFSWRIENLLKYGEDNVLTVKVSHPDLADSRWFTGSGIYRKVSLIAEEKIHAEQNGIWVTTEKVTEEHCAQLMIHSEIIVPDELESTWTQQYILLDEKGIPVVETGKMDVDQAADMGKLVKTKNHSDMYVDGEKVFSFDIPLQVVDVRLWDVEDPYLYSLQLVLGDGEKNWIAGQVPVGIRTAVFAPDHGFLLNGRPVKMRGVCLHHDGGCVGSAMTAELWQRRLENLRKAGCNAIRCSHNPHMPELYDLCDRMGFLMMDEAFDEWENPKNKWSTGHNVYPPKHFGYAEDFPTWHEKDLSGMVRRDRMHPSIVMWSIGNEIDYPNDPYVHKSFTNMVGNNDANKPAEEMRFNPLKPDASRMVHISCKLCDIVKKSDKSRPVLMALAFPELSVPVGIYKGLDLAGYNYKEQYYDRFHKEYPQMPLIGSENGHNREAWEDVMKRPFVSGQFLWTGVDYLGEAHGWPIHASGAGILDMAGFKKEGFYETKEIWRKDSGLDSEAPEEVSSNEAAELKLTIWKGQDSWAGQDVYGKCAFEDACMKEGYRYQLEAVLTDEQGIRTLADRRLEVSIEGPGRLVGIENGNLADVTPYRVNYRDTWKGRALVVVERTGAGEIAVNCTCGDKKACGILPGIQ